MCDTKDCILLRWRAAMAGKGVSPLPTEAELTDICTLGRIPENPSPAVKQWGHVLAYLQSQGRFGVTWEGVHLPTDLQRPLPIVGLDDARTPETPAVVPGSKPRVPPMERLRAWRDAAVGDGRLTAQGANDQALMRLIPTMRSSDDVGQRVATLAQFAHEIFDLLSEKSSHAPPPASESTGLDADADAVDRTRPRSSLELPPAGAHEPAEPRQSPTRATRDPLRLDTPVYPPTSWYSGARPSPRESSVPAKHADELKASPSTEPAPEAPASPPPQRPNQSGVDPEEDLAVGYAESTNPAAKPSSTIVESAETDAGLVYRWPAETATGTIYRVVVSPERPLLPEFGELLAATRSTSAVDPSPVTGLFRFVQVWANSGESVAAAKASQPRLIAECVRVGQVREPSGAADYGQVSLVWDAPKGAKRVRVYRLPSGGYSSSEIAGYEICAGQANLSGCLDRGGEAGATYTYRMIVEAQDATGAIHTSGPVDLDLEWPAVLREVTDLTIHLVQPPTKFEPGIVDLEWTQPPVGMSRLYRINQPMGAGILGVEVDPGALPQMGLTDKEQCRNPTEPTGAPDRMRMSGVVWPPNWPRAHFVPVTILGQRALPGRPATIDYLEPPGDPRLVDRVTQQVVTFVWSPGATYVRAHLGPVGADAQSVCSGRPFHQISEDDYRRHGGMRFSVAPPNDAAIFLVAVRGEVTSAAASVKLIKRLLVRYSVDIRRRFRVGPVENARVVLWAPQDQVTGSPPFVVVFRDDRLPMHAGDGVVLSAVPDETPDAAPTLMFRPATLMGGAGSPRWRILIPGGSPSGYVRLFVAPAAGPDNMRKVVVFDPPVSQLRWG